MLYKRRMLDFCFSFIENKVRFICYKPCFVDVIYTIIYKIYNEVITDFNRLLRLSIVVCEVKNI